MNDYNNGFSVKELAEKYKCSQSTIRNRIKKLGVKFKSTKITLTEKQRGISKTMLDNGKSISEIERVLGITHMGIILEREGLYTQKRGNKPLSNKEKKKIVELKEKGFDTVQIGKIIKRHDSTVGRYLKQCGYVNDGNFKEKLNPEMKKDILRLYTEERKTVKQIREEYGYNFVCAGTIEKLLRKHGVTRLGGNHNWSNNSDYFKNIDTGSKAYVLGYLLADGSNTGKGIRLMCTYKDKEIIEYVRDEITPSNEIREYVYGKKHMAYCSVGSSDMMEDLENLNFIKNKQCANLHFPKIPEELYPDFIRGYFDGDGCVTYTNNQLKISICADLNQAKDLEEILKNAKVITKENNNIVDMSKYGSNIYNLRIGRKDDVRRFFDYIYRNDNKDIFKLKRKYNVFKTYL